MRDADYLIIAMLGAILITVIMGVEMILRQTVPRVLWVPVPTGGGEQQDDAAEDIEQMELDLDGWHRNVRRFRHR